MKFKDTIKTLWDLFSVFFKIGACTFGGGYAMLPILERELADRRGWTSSDELLDYFAIGQATPGIIAVNVATFLGYKRAGVVGGFVGTAGLVCPSLIIITIIALFISNFSEIAWVQRALTGINVAVAALLTNAVYKFARKSVKSVLGVALFVIAFVLIFVFKISSIWIILGSAALGVALAAQRGELSGAGAAHANPPTDATGAGADSAESKKSSGTASGANSVGNANSTGATGTEEQR